MNDYSPTFSATSCPAVVTATGTGTATELWLAEASPLPPTPNQALCECEVASLTCVSNSNNADSYQQDFDYICGLQGGYCDGIAHNATTGNYGAYSQCNAKQQLSFVMNQYYEGQSGQAQASACTFSGRAKTQAAAKATGSCSSLLKAAGTDGSGTVPQPSGNSNQQGSSGGSGSGSGSGSSSKAAASGLTVPSFDFGLLQIGLYVTGAVVTGAGMILL